VNLVKDLFPPVLIMGLLFLLFVLTRRTRP